MTLMRWRREAPFSFLPAGLNTAIPQQKAVTDMITEIAQIDVKPGTEKDFEAAVAKARPLFLRAKGGKGFELHKSIEKPSRYRLMAIAKVMIDHFKAEGTKPETMLMA